MTLAPGNVLGSRYVVGDVLGVGGMATVYRARDERLGREVAVKILTGRGLEQVAASERFEREARVGSRLHHPHVIETFDFGRVGDTWFLVLQLISGGDLQAFRERQIPLSIDVACLVAFQVADALVAAHAIGLVHRDLKPENVLVETVQPLHVRVADFGMAYLLSSVDPKDGRLTRDGHFAGTPAYMAPEQVVNDSLGPPVDVYALGCMLYELVAGRAPFDGSTATLLAKHVYAPAPRLAAAREHVPSALDELVERMLTKSAAQRPTAEAVRHRLALLVEDGLRPHDRRAVEHASDRRARMISQHAELVAPAVALGDDGATTIGIAGTLDEDLVIGLAAAGFSTGESPAIWLAVGQPAPVIARLVATGTPVVATTPRDDFDRVSQLLRLGVVEVVLEPVLPASVIRKLRRALGARRRTP